MALTLADYKRICGDCVAVLNDIESNVPRPDMDSWNDEAAHIYALVQYMRNCLNDSPCGGAIDYYVNHGLELPEADY